MRSVSPELAAAIEARERTVRLKLSVDWDGDGHGAASPGPEIITDTFSRDVTGGLGRSDSGHLWQLQGGAASDYAVSGGAASIALTNVNVSRRPLIADGFVDFDFVATFTPSATAVGAAIRAQVMGRYVDSNNIYLFGVSFNPDGTTVVELRTRLNTGTETIVGSATVAGLTHAAGVPVRVRAKSVGSTMMVRAWPPAATEPTTWLATATSTALTQPAPVGIRTILVTGNTNTLPVTVTIDDVRIINHSIDDLSGKVAGYSRQHTLTGDVPAEARIVEGSAAAELDVDVVKGATGDERLSAVRYFSRFNADSPLSGKERMFRPVQADVEFLTSSGWQSVPRMRGLTQALPVSAADRTAQLRVLDYRQKLRRRVALPAVAVSTPRNELAPTLTTASPGLEPTWVASYVLAQCGIYASPPPRSSCRVWAPMHGSAVPHIGDNVSGYAAWDIEDVATHRKHRPVTFQPGPYLLGTETVPAGEDMWLQYVTTHNMPDRLIRADGHAIVRIECWAKVAGGGVDPFELRLFNTSRGGGTTVRLLLAATGLLQLTYADGLTANNRTVNGPTIAFTAGWRFIGAYIDTAGGQAVFRVDGVSTTVPFATFTPNAAWNPTDEVYDFYAGPARAGTALAELHVSAGGTATDLWINEMPFTPGATIDRLQNRLNGLARTDSVDAWQLLSELVAAEFGGVYWDELGVVQVASLARLVSTQAQTVQRTVTSATAITDLAYDDKTDTVRNAVTCGYTPVEQHTAEVIWESREKIFVGAQSSVQVMATLDGLPVSPMAIELAANTAADGTGTVVADGAATDLVDGVAKGIGSVISPIFVRVDRRELGTPVPVTIINRHYAGVWLVDASGTSKVRIRTNYLKTGSGSETTIRHEASIVAFGEQPLGLASNPWRQTASAARGAAMVAALNLAWPQQPLTNVQIVADPRLQFYDRIRVGDQGGTELDADYWVTGSREQFDGGYTMGLAARPARKRFLAGSGLVGVDLVG